MMTQLGKKDLLAGIDFGTGGCKVTVITFEGKLAGEASIEYPTYFPHPSWAEQEASSWYDAMCKAFEKIGKSGLDLKRIASIAFDGSTHNAVLLDKDRKVLRPVIMWTDQRSTKECEELSVYADKIFDTAFQMPAPTWTLPQLLWLKKHESHILEKTSHILFVKDYVRFLVTGEALSDHIEAQGTLFYDMKKKCFSKELFALTGMDFKVLPELIQPADAAGKVTKKAAWDMGVEEGTLVVCGTSDSAVEDYGAGAIYPGDCIVKLATAGNVNVMTDKAYPHKKTLTYEHICKGMYYTVSATNAAALCQRWFRDNFCEKEKFEAEKSGEKVFALMDHLAAESPAGSNNVMFHPYLQGERSPYWDAALRASFTGAGIHNSRSDFARALLEGVAFSLLDCYGLIEEMGLDVKRLILIGGGGKSKLWSRIVCNVFDLPLSVPYPADASFGSALLAGTGLGIFESPEEAVKKCLYIQREETPDKKEAEVYKKLFEKYRAVHDALAPVYKKFS